MNNMGDGRGPVPDRGPEALKVIWTLTPLALATAILRIIARFRNGKFGWDDIFMLLSMLCFIGWSVILTLYAQRGGLRHIEDVVNTGPDNVATVLFLNWLSQPFGIIGVAAGKISVSALLLGIIRMTEMRWHRLFLWVVPITLAALIGIACSILTFAQCLPAEALWDKRVKGTCIDPHVMGGFGTFTGGQLRFVAVVFIVIPASLLTTGIVHAAEAIRANGNYAAFNTFADASLAIVPATIFWQLNSTTTEKVQLTIVFGLNILTSICSGIKTQYLVELANRSDQTWTTYNIFVWVTGELFLMIVCGSIPTLHMMLTFLRRVVGTVKSKTIPNPSRRTGTKTNVPGPLEDPNTELSRMTHMHVLTTTTIARGRTSYSESVDYLVEEKGLPDHGVRVDTMYHVRSDTRPNSEYSRGSVRV